MRKLTVLAIVIAASTLAACAPSSPYRGGSYGYVENGMLYADRSPYNGEFWDRYYYGPRYY
jgi:hypothetical protein